jgi:hypothetical protein
VINNTGDALSDYQVSFTIHRSDGSDSGDDVYIGSSGCESDYDDIRFTKSDGETLLDYWIEESDENSATIWVEVDTITASGDTTIYLYYGAAGASAYSNGDDTFDFFDDFESGSIDTDKWNVIGTASITSGVLDCGSTSQTNDRVLSKTTFAVGSYTWRSKAKVNSYTTIGTWGFWLDSPRHVAGFYTDAADNNQFNTDTRNPSGDSQIGIGTSYGTDYHVWEIELVSTSLIEYYVDGSNVKSETSSCPYVDIPIRVVGYSANNHIYTDWVLVRKYTATEPTVSSYSVEQTEPSPDIFWTYENTPTNLTLVADTWTTFKIEGIVVDTADLTNLAVFIWVDDTDAAVDDVVYISQVQLCEGDVALPFQPKRYSEELRDCQRFYQALTIQTENGTRWIAFPATMRASPALTTDTGSTANQSPDGFDLTHTASAQADITADSEL